jgi:two-component system, OmpR family, response regulator
MSKALHNILYVDDEEDIREVVDLSLQLDSGLDVAICPSGRAALRYLESCIPDLVVLDVMMPELDGPGTLLQMRSRPETAAVPVIFLTAKAQRDEIERFRQLGAIGIIAKPFDPMTLAQQLRQIWDEHYTK